MKKVTPIFLLLLLLLNRGIILGQNKVYKTVAERKQYYIGLAKKYNSPEILEILKNDAENKFENYVHGHSEKELFEEYGTVVHELLHSYDGIDFDGHHYLVGPNSRVYVPYTKYFKSPELNAFVRKSAQDSILRYGLYVGGTGSASLDLTVKSNISEDDLRNNMSVTKGIYGMMEEFTAYMYESVAMYELHSYYAEKFKYTDTDPWEIYAHHVYSQSYAYYEFNLFMGWYLQYAKKNHPEIYKEIFHNKELRVVYSLLDAKFSKVLSDFTAKVNEIEKKIAENTKNEETDSKKTATVLDFNLEDMKEFEYTENGVTKTIKVKDLSKEELAKFKAMFSQAQQYKNPNEAGWLSYGDGTAEYLKSLFTKDLTLELAGLKIGEVTLSNYKDFLK